jgi:hypothetical protein
VGGVWRGDAKAHDHRKIGLRFDPGDLWTDIGGFSGGSAGDAGDRDVIDKARGVLQHLGQAFVIGGGRGKADEVEASGLGGQAKLGILLGRQVDDDQAVDADFVGFGKEPVDATP